MHLGERLRELRQQQGLTMSALAADSGLTKGFLSQIEAGRSSPSLVSLGKLAAALKVSTSELLTDMPAGGTVRSLPHVYRRNHLRLDVPSLQALDIEGPVDYYLAVLRLGVHLAGSPSSTVTIPEAICLVRRGAVVLSAEGNKLHLSSGDLVTWKLVREYTITTEGDLPSEVMLCLPRASTIRQIAMSEEGKRDEIRVPAQLPDGPFRLVAMRAQRRTAGRG